MFSPTTATVARSRSAVMSLMSPVLSSFTNSSRSTFTAFSASAFFTANEVLCSDEACDTRNTLTPLRANALKMRELMPITPTIPKPVRVIRQVSLIDEMPLMALPSEVFSSEMSVPGADGLNVFFIKIGIFLWKTG